MVRTTVEDNTLFDTWHVALKHDMFNEMKMRWCQSVSQHTANNIVRQSIAREYNTAIPERERERERARERARARARARDERERERWGVDAEACLGSPSPNRH